MPSIACDILLSCYIEDMENTVEMVSGSSVDKESVGYPDAEHLSADPVVPEPVSPPAERSWDMSATYSPDDNKLRLSSLYRLDEQTFQRVKAAGFIWAPKQGIFVAPMWTPARADLLIELCGGIGDEDTSLCDRAEDRAERFEGYRERRTSDAEAAERGVHALTANIPLGQPILVGHHSERRARKDAERIESGLRKAVKMWDTADYWRRRAAGAVHHARYKERPDVRYRRIKGLEADRRRQEKRIEVAAQFMKLWQAQGLTSARAMAIANYDHVRVPQPGQTRVDDSLWGLLRDEKLTAEVAAKTAVEHHTRQIDDAKRWLEHISNRISYERAMLGEDGNIPAARFAVEVGGEVLIDGKWCIVLRTNIKGGELVSVRATCPYSSRGWVRGIEEVRDYRPPTVDQAAKAKAATKLPSLCNYPGEGFREMTQAQWNRLPKDYKGTHLAKTCERFGTHRYRQTFANVGLCGLVQVYITDAKRTDPPAPHVESEELPPPRPSLPRTSRTKPAEPKPGADVRERLRQGVQIVSAPELFPTPPALAARMVELADLSDGHTLLEPSAGTGALLDAVKVTGRTIQTTAVELNQALAQALGGHGIDVRQANFLECGDELGKFDRVLMNPPFGDAQDIAHILHARRMLNPGGILVAICAGGPRQSAALQPLVVACGGHWEAMPTGTFVGTSVRSVLLSLKGPTEP
jgi:hypothetical protein